MRTQKVSVTLASHLVTLVVGMTAIWGAGCGVPPVDQIWRSPLSVQGPFVGERGELVYVHTSFGEALRVVPKRGAEGVPGVELERVELGGAPSVVEISEDKKTLYALDPAGRTLHVLGLEEGAMSRRSVALSGVYDRLTLDPSGEFVLLTATPGSTAGGRLVARNLNEVGIVDLRGEELEARFVTLSSPAQRMVFAQPFRLGGSPQRLVAAMSRSEVGLLDLLATDEANALRVVPLTLSNAEAVRLPRQVLFDVVPKEDQPDVVSLYVLTEDAADITQVSIAARQPSAERPLKFDLSVNQLAAGQRPGSMLLLDLPEQGPRLLALDRAQARFTLVDVTSGEGGTFGLPSGVVGTAMIPYTMERAMGGSELRVLVYSTSSPVVSVIHPETIALGGDAPSLGRSVETIRLERNPSRVVYDSGAAADRAVVFHEGLTSGFSVLNLRSYRDIPIEGFALADVYLDGAYAYGVFSATADLVAFELSTGHPASFELPMVGQRIALDAQEGLLLVQHDGELGTFTVLDAESPTPDQARVVRDLFLSGLLDRTLSTTQD